MFGSMDTGRSVCYTFVSRLDGKAYVCSDHEDKTYVCTHFGRFTQLSP